MAGLAGERHALLQPFDGQVVRVPKVGAHAEVEQRPCDAARVAVCATDRERLRGDRLGRSGFTAAAPQIRQGVERPTAVTGRGAGGAGKGLFEPGAAFLKVSATFPEVKQRCRCAQRGMAVRVGQRPAQRDAQVVVLDFEAVQ